MKKKLSIIGASYLQLPLVEKANKMGIETHCFAWEEGAVCKNTADYFYPISVVEKKAILEKCIEIGIDGIVSIASDAVVPTVCFTAEKMNLISNSYQSSEICTNKYLMRRKFVSHDINSPRFFLADNNEKPFLAEFRFPLIVKPVDRSGSRGVSIVERIDKLQPAIERALNESFSNQAIVEEFIFGDEVSVETISWEGKHYILAITDKITTGKPHFVELEHHQPSILDSEIQDKIKQETKKALDALFIRYGATHSEFKITPDGKVYAIEVGARMGGDFIGSDLVYLSTGYDFVKAVIEIALGYFYEPSFTIEKHSGVYFLSKETQHLETIIKSKEFEYIVSAEITNDSLNYIQNSADRSGYLIYQSEERIKL